jgi:hypothetical protein
LSGFSFRCPTTGREIDPGIDCGESGLRGTDAIRFVALHVRCPHCSEHHEIKIDEDALNKAA